MGPPFPPVPNVIQIVISGTTPTEMWQNVFYAQYSGPAPSASALNAFAAGVTVGWGNTVSSLCPAPIVLTKATLTDLASNTGAEGVSNVNTPGSRGDEMIGANTAVLISYPSPQRYRGGKPRTYLLAGGFADIDGGMMWHASFINNEVKPKWDAFFANFIGMTSGGTTLTQHVFVRRHGRFLPNAGPPNYVLTTPLVFTIPAGSSVVHQQAASQKGRIGRRSK